MVGKEKVQIPTREPDGKKDDGSAIWWDSPDGKNDILVAYEADKKTISSIVIGVFDTTTKGLIEGKDIRIDYKDEGKFDKDTGKMVDGKRTFSSGEIQKGKFDKDAGKIIDGEVRQSNGHRSKGKYDKDTGYLIEGTFTYKNGTVEKGTFDKNTGDLLNGTKTEKGKVTTYKDGKIVPGEKKNPKPQQTTPPPETTEKEKTTTLLLGTESVQIPTREPDGKSDDGKVVWWYSQDKKTEIRVSYEDNKGTIDNVMTGIFDKETAALVNGKQIWKDGTVIKGSFDKDTGNLTEGTYTHKNGTVEKGIFDKTSGDLLNGTKTENGKVTQYKDGKVVEQSSTVRAASVSAPAPAASVSEKVTTTNILSHKEFTLLSPVQQEEKLKKIIDEQIRVIDSITTEQGLVDMDAVSTKIQKMVGFINIPPKLQTLLDSFIQNLEEKRVDMRNTQREATITRLDPKTGQMITP